MTHNDTNPFRRLPPTAAHHGRGRRRRPLRRHRRPGRPGRHRPGNRTASRSASPCSAPPTCTATSTTGTTSATRPTATAKANHIGVAKAASLIKMVRAERGADRCITLDAGDTIQGTPLAYYYAKIDPITAGAKHPMATAMNALGYDAAALGQPRVQLRPRHAARLRGPVRPPAAVGELGRLGHRRADLHARTCSSHRGARRQAGHRRHPRPGHPGRRDLGRDQRRGQGALPRHRRAGEGHGAPDEGRRRRRRRRLVPLRARPPRRPTATRCRTPRTPAGCSPSRCPTSTRSSSATRTSRSPS